ncbi:MAG TPA: hypothetical protein VFB36_17160 [Nevskiaceae bacterium]|nr:hypothetical protein [Nevskiaceae bacterium]
MTSSAKLAALAALSVVTSAFADQPLSNAIAPTVSLGYSFGADARQLPSQFSARFDLRSTRLRGAAMSFHSDPATDDAGVAITRMTALPLVNVLELSATRKGVDSLHVLWHDMLQSTEQLNEDGTSESGSSHKWIWWTAGAIVAAGATALATSSHSSNDNSDQPTGTPPNGGGNCVGVTGNVPGDFSIDNSGCPGNVPSVP